MSRILTLGLVAGASLLGGCALTAPRSTYLDQPQGPIPAQAQAKARQYIDQAHGYQAQGLSDSALAAFGLALEENPTLVEAQLGMGRIYQRRGQYRFSESAYERAHRLAPDRFETNYSLAVIEQILGKTSRAVTLYLKALTIEPDNPDANRELAGAYLTLERPEQALPYAKRAVDLNPDSQGALVNLATTYRLLGQDARAVAAYREATELGRLGDPILPGLADAHIQLGHYYRAINVLQTLAQHHDTARSHERMGYAYFKLGRYAQALKQYRTALGLAPDNAAALNGQGVCLMTRFLTTPRTLDNQDKLRDLLKAARASWRKSLLLNPDQPRILALLNRYQSF